MWYENGLAFSHDAFIGHEDDDCGRIISRMKTVVKINWFYFINHGQIFQVMCEKQQLICFKDIEFGFFTGM